MSEQLFRLVHRVPVAISWTITATDRKRPCSFTTGFNIEVPISLCIGSYVDRWYLTFPGLVPHGVPFEPHREARSSLRIEDSQQACISDVATAQRQG